MLSNPLHRFSAYNTIPSNNMLSTGHLSSNHMHASGLDSLTHGSQYALQQLQQHVDLHQHHHNSHQVHRHSNSLSSKHRQHPYSNGIGTSGRSNPAASTQGPIRRRISRACDQCNQLRTKCDGQNPCAHCVEFGLGCEYIRERKKRGKASRKDLAQQAAAAANGQKSPSGGSSGDRSPTDSRNENSSSTASTANDNGDFQRPQISRSLSLNTTKLERSVSQDFLKGRLRAGSLESLNDLQNGHHSHDQMDSPASLSLNGYSNMHGYRSSHNTHLLNGNAGFNAGQSTLSGYPELPYALQNQSPSHYAGNTPGAFRLGDSPIPNFSLGSETTSPGAWMSIPSPSNQYHHVTQPSLNGSLRYPVLQPLLPHLGNILPVSLACDMLELYFASSSPALMHPTSPYILGYVFRKHSILHPTKPRQCTSALLASMLWVVAQTSDAAFLTASPSSRGRICQPLFELTVGLLKPLVHGASDDASPSFSNSILNGAAIGGLGVAAPGSVHSDGLNESGAFGTAGSLDDIVTYIHLATVVSASEYKGASLRWWNAAWSLARELKLGRELPQNSLSMVPQANEAVDDVDADGEADDDVPSTLSTITEEEREERRRIWWLVYAMDRHLALCYNRPLFLLDIECDGLLQPMDDALWQAGDFYSGDSSIHITSPSSGTPRIRGIGPNFECTGHSIFGYFLPLMTILGAIVDLYHAKNHPRFGTAVGFRSTKEWDEYTAAVTRQLDAYSQSLKDFEAHQIRPDDYVDKALDIDVLDPSTPSIHSIHTSSAHRSELEIRTRIVVAYSTHIMHVLHILLEGKWDPVSLLDDNDSWTSSQGFINAMGHAISAADAMSSILDYDPGLDFMPFFLGVYLLQGSFLLLSIAEKSQARPTSRHQSSLPDSRLTSAKVEASPSVIKACETIIRAHEPHVITLSTDYQRNFRKLMRIALAQMKGRVLEDFGEQQLRRQNALALYRWTGDGTGLAS